jgi:hypothetical protein
MSGEANYGGNGSVHWQVVHKTNGSSANFIGVGQRVEGQDPSPVPVLGPEGDGCFSVRLRFDTAPIGAAAAAGSASVAGASVDTTLIAARRLQIEVALADLAESVRQALATIQKQSVDTPVVGEVVAKVPAVNRPNKPAADWEIHIEW